MPSPAELLAPLPPASAYAAIFAIVVLESVLLIGPVVPTFALLLCAGYLARTGTLDLAAVVACAAAGVVTGDLLAHQTGRRLGPRLRSSRLGRRIPATAWDRTWAAVLRHGGAAVLACRFVPVLRTVAPHVVGAAGLPYRRLAPYSVAAGVVWASAEAGTGYLGGGFAGSVRLVVPAGVVSAGVVLTAGVVAARRLAVRCSGRVHQRRAPAAAGGTGGVRVAGPSRDGRGGVRSTEVSPAGVR
jgi:membrane protein DedA with SNARE-associated domain